MKKKIFILVLLCILFILTGCENKNKNNDSTQILALWDNLSFIIGDDLDKAIESDELSIEQGLFDDIERSKTILENTKILREYGKEKNIVLSSSNMGWNDGLTTALLSCFWMQDGPDIIQGEEQLPQFVEDGYIEPFPDGMAQRIREKCSPIAYKGLERDGKLYGLAIQPGLTLLYWNKALLRSAGYTDDDPIMTNGPKDWAEWLEAMDRVDQVNGRNNNPHGGGVYVGAHMGAYLRVGALLDSAGTSYDDINGAPKVNTDEAYYTYDFISKQRQYNLNGICNSIDYAATYDKAFSRGEIAFKVDGNWCMYELDRLGIDYGVSLIPPRVEGEESGTMQIGACYMCVPTYSKHKEEAFYILECMLDEKIQQNIATIGFRMPVLKSIITSDEYKEKHPTLATFANLALTKNIPILPPFKGNVSEIWNSVGSSFGQTYTLNISESSIREILRKLEENMLKFYNKK